MSREERQIQAEAVAAEKEAEIAWIEGGGPPAIATGGAMMTLGERARAAVLAYEAERKRLRQENERWRLHQRTTDFRTRLWGVDINIPIEGDAVTVDGISLRLDQDGSELEVGLKCSVCRTAVWRAFKTLLELGYWLEQAVWCYTCTPARAAEDL